MQVLTSLSGLQFSAASAGFAPTNSAEVSAIASSYQVVSSTGTQLHAGTAYLTGVNGAPISASRAGQAANASLSNSAYYDGTGRLISALPDSAAVSAIASSYAESAASGKQDTIEFGYDANNLISSIDGSALAGGGGGGVDSATVSAIASAYVESGVSSKLDSSASSSFYTTANESGFVDSAYVDSAVSGKMDASAIDYTRTGGGTQIYASGNGSSTNQFSAKNDSAGAAIIAGENARLRLWDTAATANLYASSIGGWNAASNLVSSQSANWGGSALQLSAGEGISLTMSGNILIIATASA